MTRKMSKRLQRRMASQGESEFPVGHEGDASFFTQRILYDELAHQRTVFLVDLPGYGSAPNPHRDVSIVDRAGVLARFLSAAGIERPVLVGHSMGTQVITQLARDYPATTNRLVLLAPTMDPAARGFWHATGRLLRDILTARPPEMNAIVSVDYFFRCGIPYFLKQSKAPSGRPHLPGGLDARARERAAGRQLPRGQRAACHHVHRPEAHLGADRRPCRRVVRAAGC